MKGFCFAFVFFLLAPLIFSSGGDQRSGQTESANTQTQQTQQAWEYKGIPVLDSGCKLSDFPLAVYNPPPDKLFRAAFSGKVADNSFRQDELNIFTDRLVIEIKKDYVLYNKKQEATYYALVSDFRKSAADGTSVSPGDVLGRVEQREAKIVIFSKSLDPYLVLNSDRPPVFYAGYFWFSPSFLSPSGSAEWIAFDPVGNIDTELAKIAGQVTEENPGLAFYDKRIRFKTKLAQFPRNISEDERISVSAYENMLYGRNGIIGNVNEINAGGYRYLLCWQRGFPEYLKREYTLNDDIWLYGTIVTYDVWKQTGYIFLRDFTPVSLEEMYEGRLGELKGN